MRKFVCHVFLLLLMVLPMMAMPYEQTEEYAQKQAILNERAARFKAETGFEGDIWYNQQFMKFSNFFGNFRDIPVTAPQDTVFMKQVFDRVVVKVMPYISAREGQLIRGKTSSNINGTGARYEQIVNGYRIEGAGFLNVAYNFDTNKITVTDATVDIAPQQIPISITMDQAIQIAIQHYDPNYKFDANNSLTHPRSKLVYFPIPDDNGSNRYQLCYMIAFWGLTIFIDPSSGAIIHTRSLVIEDYHCNVDGEVYESV